MDPGPPKKFVISRDLALAPEVPNKFSIRGTVGGLASGDTAGHSGVVEANVPEYDESKDFWDDEPTRIRPMQYFCKFAVGDYPTHESKRKAFLALSQDERTRVCELTRLYNKRVRESGTAEAPPEKKAKKHDEGAGEAVPTKKEKKAKK